MITGRRAALAVAAPVLAPPVVVGLARAGRWPGAAVLSLLFGVYVGIEVVSWLRRERRRRRLRWARLRTAGRPLADVTESREGWVA